MSHHDDEPSFFDQERQRLTAVITSEFDDLLTSTNDLNRKLEEVLSMTKEYSTIAELWGSFYQLMRSYGDGGEEQGAAS
ncbi:hypothetical protein FB45DRAFT_1021057 [Roridomyces roridus]|uniref:DASH complex subunit DAD1 n=1 Tax=Roridomyces roridus TaxID=1738132 RepID=A0AAD7CB74_9AGAR|nr:hypothetical protein FB45DRAFT_1021057 [Roridomyces roridus]